jgi:hypothetical protein
MARVSAVDAPDDPPSAEELSFGEDPDREPRVREWVAAHRGLLAVGAAVLVLAGALGGGGWYLHDQAREPLPPPDVPVPAQLTFQVSVCGEAAARCQTDSGRVIADTPRIEAALRGIPEIASVSFLSAAGLYQSWHDLADRVPGPDSAFTLTRADFVDVFEGTLRRSADYPAVAARVRAVHGVQDVVRVPTDFWAGKADVDVTLCGRLPEKACASITGHQVSDDQRQAIVDRIHEVDGVEKVYFEDRAHALMLQRLYNPELGRRGPPLILELMKESLYVKTGTPKAAEAVRQAVKGMLGVASVG